MIIMNAPAISLSNVTKSYKSGFSLNPVSFSLPTGEILGLIGENGAGKTTLIKIIMDVIHPTGGHVKIFDKENRPIIKEDIGVVLDECCFHETLSVKNINSILKHVYANWDEHYFSELLDKFSLTGNKRIGEFSKGMKVKLNFACALSHKPKLLILDEVTSGLDPLARKTVLDIIMDFMLDDSHATLISTHITSDLEHIADKIAFMQRGNMVLFDDKDSIMERYAMLKCSKEQLYSFDSSLICGKRITTFGVEALITDSEKIAAVMASKEWRKKYLSESAPPPVLDKVSLDDIVVYRAAQNDESKEVVAV